MGEETGEGDEEKVILVYVIVLDEGTREVREEYV